MAHVFADEEEIVWYQDARAQADANIISIQLHQCILMFPIHRYIFQVCGAVCRASFRVLAGRTCWCYARWRRVRARRTTREKDGCGSLAGHETRSAEQSRAGQAREQCPFEESSPSSLSRLLATQGMHAVTRLHAISLSFSPLRSFAFYGRVRRESFSRDSFLPLRLDFPPCTCYARVPSI